MNSHIDSSATLFVISAPSGAGKSTLVNMLLEREASVQLSISYTTRQPRSGEVDGVNYHFVDVPTFTAMRAHNDFVEWAEVYGNFYGTSRSAMEKQLATGRDLVLEIDWQGAWQVRQQFRQSIGVFILPPSVEELERRLRARGQDSDDVIRRRVAVALDEMQHVSEFDFVIINKDLAAASDDLLAAVRGARLLFNSQRARYPDVFRFLELG